MSSSLKERRARLRAVLAEADLSSPGSVFDPLSARLAAHAGYRYGLLGGSIASAVVLGAPDVVVLTLTELADQVRRISRGSDLPFIVDADHGYGNALNVRRTVEELEAAGAAGLTIEDTLLPQAFGQAKMQLISLEEGVGKMKAGLDSRSDASLVIMARTGAVSVTGLENA